MADAAEKIDIESDAASVVGFARLVAKLVVAELRAPERRVEYSQDSPPAGMSKRTYLDHCYAGHWPSSKRGRLRVTKASDYEAWAESRPRKKKRAEGSEIVDELAFVKSGGKEGVR